MPSKGTRLVSIFHDGHLDDFGCRYRGGWGEVGKRLRGGGSSGLELSLLALVTSLLQWGEPRVCTVPVYLRSAFDIFPGSSGPVTTVTHTAG